MYLSNCSFLTTSVLFVITMIAIHHYCHDRDVSQIPDYVKNSMQFSSDEDSDYDEEEMRALNAFQIRRGQLTCQSLNHIKVLFHFPSNVNRNFWLPASTKSGTSIAFKEGPTNSKKTLLLDRFMNDFNDRQRGNKNWSLNRNLFLLAWRENISLFIFIPNDLRKW